MKIYHFGLFLVAAFILGACNTVIPADQSPSSTVGTTRAYSCPDCWGYLGSPQSGYYSFTPGGDAFGSMIQHPILTMNGTTPMAMWDAEEFLNPLSVLSCPFWRKLSSTLVGNLWSENSVPQFPACGTRRAIAPQLKSPPTSGNMLFYDNTVVRGGATEWIPFGTAIPMNGLGFADMDTDKTNESNGYAVAQTDQGIPTVAFSAYLLSDSTRTSKIFMYRWQNNTWANIGKQQLDGSFDNGDSPKLVLRGDGNPVIAYRKIASGGTYRIVTSQLNSMNIQTTRAINSKTMFVYPDFSLVLDDSQNPIVAYSESLPNTGNTGTTQLMVRSIDSNGGVNTLGTVPLETAGVGLSYKPFMVFNNSTLWIAYRFNNLVVKGFLPTSNTWKQIGYQIAPTNINGYQTSIDTPQLFVQPNQNLLVMFNQINTGYGGTFGDTLTKITELKVYSRKP